MRRSATAFQVVIVAGAIFVALTVAAMLLYPGGRVGDTQSVGYAFFTNFFSDLGQTTTYAGHDNRSSLILFCLALAAIAVAMATFFVTFAAMFPAGTRARGFATAGAACGAIAAVCFVGVAATPWNLYLSAHNDFVQWAFRSFLLAVVLCAIASLLDASFPRRFAAVFGAFALLLAAYVGLLTVGPSAATPSGAAVQATGQKIIVYASLLTIVVQAISARAWLRSPAQVR